MLGALATEDRCLSVLHHDNQGFSIAHSLLLRIVDPPSHFSQLCEQHRSRLLVELTQLRGAVDSIADFDLLSLPKTIRAEVERFVADTNGRIILDVTSLPKRYFFPILRWLVVSATVNDLVVTYSTAT